MKLIVVVKNKLPIILNTGITPRTIKKTKEHVFAQTSVLDIKGYDPKILMLLQPMKIL